MEKSNKTSNFSVELTVKNNDVVETFDSLKELQEMGYAGVDSTIVYKKSSCAGRILYGFS